MIKIKVGYVSTGQFSFPGDKKAIYDQSVKELTALSHELGFDLYLYPTMVVTQEDAESAVNALKHNDVDFLLLQCTSFSSGYLIPVFAKARDISLGLWAISEGKQDGPVPFNSFCAVNMYSGIIGHYLKDYKIKFKWFYGDAKNPLFINRFRLTVRALTAIKNLKRSKIGLIGGIAPGFEDLYFDERPLLSRFDGMKLNRLHEFSEIADRAKKYKYSDIENILEEMKKESKNAHPNSISLLETNARVYKSFKDFLDEYKYDALTVSCWPKFQQVFDRPFSVCSVVARLNDESIPTACEGDVTSAVSMLLLKHLAQDETMLMDLTDFDEKDQTVLLWHCGPAAKRFMGKKGYTLGVNYSALPHCEGEELSCCGITREMVFAPGPATVARLTGEHDRIFIAGGSFTDYEKKSFHGSRGWMGNLTFAGKDIAVRDLINTALVQRFQHHYPIVLGNHTDSLMEISAWLGLELVQAVPYEDYLQNGER